MRFFESRKVAYQAFVEKQAARPSRSDLEGKDSSRVSIAGQPPAPRKSSWSGSVLGPSPAVGHGILVAMPTYRLLFSEFPGEADPHNARDRNVQNLNPKGGGSADP